MITSYIIVLLAVSASVRAQYLLAEYAPKHDNYKPANYHFSYGVSDPTTGDHKHHWEKRQGDHVVGEYGLLEPDGATRIVQYTADPHNGFQAVVKRIENPYQVSPDQYTQGHALYGGQHQGLYNSENVVQFDHPQNVVLLQQQEQQQEPQQYQEHLQQHQLQQQVGHDEALSHHVTLQASVETPHGSYPVLQQSNIENQQQEHIISHQKSPEAVYEHKIISDHNSNIHQANLQNQQINHLPEDGNQYYLNQYAGGFRINVPDYEQSLPENRAAVSKNVEIQNQNQAEIQLQTIQAHASAQNPEAVQHNEYSTLQHQPNYVELKEQTPHQIYQHEQNLPQHVIDNIHNQYNDGNTNIAQGSLVLEPRGFSHENQNQGNEQSQIYQESVNEPHAAQIPQQIQKEFVHSSNQNYLQGNLNNNNKNIAYVTTPSPAIYFEHTTAQPNIQHNVQVITNNNGQNSAFYPQQTATDFAHAPPNVEVIPNGEGAQLVHAIQQQNHEQAVQVTTEKSVSMNPILFNLMTYIKDHMPNKYKQQFETALKPYGPTPIANVVPTFNQETVSSTTHLPLLEVKDQNIQQNYAHNPYLNGEFNNQNTPGNLRETLQNEANRQINNQNNPYGHNPYLNGEVKLAGNVQQTGPIQQDYKGDLNNYDQNLNSKNIYYELDPAAYQQNVHSNQNLQPNTNSQQQGESGTIFQAVNENGYNLRTPNFYQPINPNLYNNQQSEQAVANTNDANQGYQGGYSENAFHLQQSRQINDNVPSPTNNDFIWNAGDPTAPRDPEILVRQLNATCLHFRFNETNDYTERDQDPHIWNAGDYTALRPEEEYIRSVNVTCDNFTNDALSNFTSGFNLWQYCSQCLNKVDEDATVVNKEVIIDQNGQKIEVFYQQKPENTQIYSNPQNDGNSYGGIAGLYKNFQDERSNGEIAGIVQVYNPNYNPSLAKNVEISETHQNTNSQPEEIQINENLAALLNNFNNQVNKNNGQAYLNNPQVAYNNDAYQQVPTNGEYSNGLYKRSLQLEKEKTISNVDVTKKEESK